MATARHQVQEIKRLTSSFPVPSYGTPEERFKAFLAASRDYADEILTAAVSNLVEGKVPSVNPNYLPTSAALGNECQRLANQKAESDERTRRYTYKALPEPERAPVTPESKARVRAMIEEFRNGPGALDPVTGEIRGDNAPEALSVKAAARFIPNQEPDDMRKRLFRRD